MENSKFNLPTIGPSISSKYVLRSTKEEVEVIAFEQPENGARSNEDWVTYIDSNGVEHIKEHLNIQLDFKLSGELLDMFSSIFKSSNLPSVIDQRIFDITKTLVIEKGYKLDVAIDKAKSIVDKVREVVNEDE